MSKKNLVDKINARNTHSTNQKAGEDMLVVSPEEYAGLQDISDDYELTAKLIHTANRSQKMKKIIEEHINGEELSPYGPKTNYKSAYRYNGDD